MLTKISMYLPLVYACTHYIHTNSLQATDIASTNLSHIKIICPPVQMHNIVNKRPFFIRGGFQDYALLKMVKHTNWKVKPTITIFFVWLRRQSWHNSNNLTFESLWGKPSVVYYNSIHYIHVHCPWHWMSDRQKQ